MQDLIHAPPRLSDLHGDERTIALRKRADESRDAWLRTRQQRSIWARIADMLGGVR